MGDENVELIWYGFCLIEALVLLFVCLAVALLCKWLLSHFLRKSIKRRSVKRATVHSLGTLRPPRNFEVSQSKAIDRNGGAEQSSIGRSV